MVWECELKKKTIDATLAKLLPELASELGKEITLPGGGALKPESMSAGPKHDPETDGTSANAAPADAAQSSPAASTPTSEPKRYYLYVLECGDGTLYTGYTPDIEARLAQHRAGTGAKYTRGARPLTLLASAEFPTKHDAMSAGISLQAPHARQERRPAREGCRIERALRAHTGGSVREIERLAKPATHSQPHARTAIESRTPSALGNGGRW